MIAWNDLSTERPIGMAAGYIPRSKIKQYGIEDLGLYDVSLDFFIAVIRKVDIEFLADEGSGNSTPGLVEEVHPTDGAGVKNLLKRLAGPKGQERFRKDKPERTER